MNIGIVTVWGERGASVVSKAYIEALSPTNNIFIYSRGGEASIRYNASEMNVWQAKESYIPITTHIDKKDFINWATSNKIELVLFNEQHWFEPLIWLKKLNIKSLSYVDYYTEETIPLYDLYDGVICNTHRHYKAFKHHPNALYLPWGLDTAQYSIDQNTSNKEKAVFFHSCGMNPLRKGTDLLLKAAFQLKGNFELIIHSQLDLNKYYQNDPETLNCLNSLVENNSLTIITKSVTAPGLYHLGNIYVYPCRLDGLGLTVPEALSSGLPCLVPDAEPMKDFASPACSLVAIDRFYCRKDGYYWPQQLCDIDDLANKMNEFIIHGNIEKKMSLARAHAVEHLDWLKNASILDEFVKNTGVIPLDQKMISTYNNYKNYGYRKVLTLIEKYKFIFTPLYFLYAKIRKN